MAAFTTLFGAQCWLRLRKEPNFLLSACGIVLFFFTAPVRLDHDGRYARHLRHSIDC
jgi:hypothetical protein